MIIYLSEWDNTKCVVCRQPVNNKVSYLRTGNFTSLFGYFKNCEPYGYCSEKCFGRVARYDSTVYEEIRKNTGWELC